MEEISKRQVEQGNRIGGLEQQMERVVRNTAGLAGLTQTFNPGEIVAHSTQARFSVLPEDSRNCNSTPDNLPNSRDSSGDTQPSSGALPRLNEPSHMPVETDQQSTVSVPMWISRYLETEEDRFSTRVRKQAAHVSRYKGYEDSRNICAFLEEVEIHAWRHVRKDEEKIEVLFNLIDHKKNQWARNKDLWRRTPQQVLVRIKEKLWDSDTQHLEIQKFHAVEPPTDYDKLIQFLSEWY